jgi:hypothetical protein
VDECCNRSATTTAPSPSERTSARHDSGGTLSKSMRLVLEFSNCLFRGQSKLKTGDVSKDESVRQRKDWGAADPRLETDGCP